MRDANKVCAVLVEFRPSHVLHLAGVSGNGHALQIQNVDTTRILFRSMVQLKLKARTVVASSGSVYGEPAYLPQDEMHPTVPVLDYAKSKLEAEQAATAFANEGGIPLTVARIFNVVGPGSPSSLLPGSLALQLAAIARETRPPKVVVGPLESVRDYIDVRDCARAISVLAFASSTGVVNVSSGVGTPVRAIFESLRKIARTHGVESFEIEPARALPSSARVHVGSNGRLAKAGFDLSVPLEQSLSDLFSWALRAWATA